MKVVYARYGRERLGAFQLETRLLRRETGQLLVEKRALVPEARAHVARLAARHRRLAGELQRSRVPLPLAVADGLVTLPFVPGDTLDALLGAAVRGRRKDDVHALLAEYLELLEIVDDAPTPASFLGPWPAFTDGRAVPSGALDLSLENLVRDESGSMWAIDLEWGADGAVPAAFVLVRCVDLLLARHGEALTSLVPEPELFDLLGVNATDVPSARALEERFQAYVFGEARPCALPASLRKDAVALDELLSERKRREELEARLAALEHETARLHLTVRAAQEGLALESRRAAALAGEKESLLLGLTGLGQEIHRQDARLASERESLKSEARRLEDARRELEEEARRRDAAREERVRKLERTLQERDQHLEAIQQTRAYRLLTELGLTLPRRSG